ncbi:hypothetical protein SPRG_15242 [Saprolegnia parasitica CBS 223.65]|uniref:START domain-containing protein n=1 Tax=Saprolegnia parasitica (strain CBS 223.65) TaxID=695850 RepID=A0A067BLA3_SAPPC|nr:hypothetical protein SPRG_15242 [Saprolegnia parasitica CBS 223.65]KDO19224.1 hypothetical protein SPRG_15242 [Saprolegnia parasitica CBS 223.65]|eukprot:XP_012210058.1 hypothetical protein SPRG_15242 [Saprolegnia parasitica CBS 223.65]
MRLDSDAWQSLQLTLHDAVQTLLQSYTSGRDELCSGYRFAKAKHGQHLFTRTTSASPFLEVLSIGNSVRSLDDVLDLCYAATSEDLSILEGLVHGDKYLDAAVLETVFAATIDDPFRWLGTKTKQIYMTGGFEKRGTTFVEYSGSLTDDLGQRVLFIMRESMPGDLPRDVIAYRLQSISLFVENATGRVQDVHYSFVDPQGKFPAWLFNQQVATHMPVTHRISMLAQKKRLLLAAMHQPVDYDDRYDLCTVSPHPRLWVVQR